MYREEALYFVVHKRCVIVPADVYQPGDVWRAMLDCERIFGRPAVGLINSPMIAEFCGQTVKPIVSKIGLARPVTLA